MTSELRPSVEVADEVWDLLQNEGADEDAIGVIEADREAVRAAVLAEICEWLRDCIDCFDAPDVNALHYAYQIAQRFGGRHDQ